MGHFRSFGGHWMTRNSNLINTIDSAPKKPMERQIHAPKWNFVRKLRLQVYVYWSLEVIWRQGYIFWLFPLLPGGGGNFVQSEKKLMSEDSALCVLHFKLRLKHIFKWILCILGDRAWSFLQWLKLIFLQFPIGACYVLLVVRNAKPIVIIRFEVRATNLP